MTNIFTETVRRVGARLRIGTASLQYEHLEKAIREELPTNKLSFDSSSTLIRRIAAHIREKHIPIYKSVRHRHKSKGERRTIFDYFMTLKEHDNTISYRQATKLLEDKYDIQTSKSSLGRIVREFEQIGPQAGARLGDKNSHDFLRACRMAVNSNNYIVISIDPLWAYFSLDQDADSLLKLDAALFRFSCYSRSGIRIVRLGTLCCISRRSESRTMLESRIIRVKNVGHVRGFPSKGDIETSNDEYDILGYALFRTSNRGDTQYDLEIIAKFLLPAKISGSVIWRITKSFNSSDFSRYASRIVEDSLDIAMS